MEFIQFAELSSTQANIVFSNIPQTYTDLYIVFSGRSDRGNAVFDNIRIMPNGTTTNVSSRILFGSGTGTGSSTEAYITGYANGALATASNHSNSNIYIANYTTSANKVAYMESAVENNNATSALTAISGGIWLSSAAITSITLDQGDGSNWLAGTSATLYGIKSGSSNGVVVS